MTIDELREYCLSKPGVTEHTPFDDRTLVFKVLGKMFCLADIFAFESLNIKCDPDLALERRETFASVLPGYHMNKRHWNTVKVNQEITDDILLQWVDESYDLVFASLPKKTRDSLENR
ncbi:MAG: MmcQ/YjbR family DNA-binding protein [Crocinitomicaceae bacterium]|jgi:predicted DNA-binding protein (MmcQ/YjbR family)|nr:MmcQ/YjbR family DNA-binding protein [Crocinitomicaceae bacterium]